MVEHSVSCRAAGVIVHEPYRLRAHTHKPDHATIDMRSASGWSNAGDVAGRCTIESLECGAGENVVIL